MALTIEEHLEAEAAALAGGDVHRLIELDRDREAWGFEERLAYDLRVSRGLGATPTTTATTTAEGLDDGNPLHRAYWEASDLRAQGCSKAAAIAEVGERYGLTIGNRNTLSAWLKPSGTPPFARCNLP